MRDALAVIGALAKRAAHWLFLPCCSDCWRKATLFEGRCVPCFRARRSWADALIEATKSGGAA